MDRREQKVIAAVACPECGAAAGVWCHLRTPTERAMARSRLLVHADRRAVWRAWRRGKPLAVRVHGQRLEACSPEVYRELDVRASAAAERHPEQGYLWVPPREVGALIIELTAAGYRVE